VQAFRVLLFFIGVAGAAVNRLEFFGMGKLLSSQIGVTTGTLQCGVRRGSQGSRVEGGRHSRLSLACARSGFVATHARLASRQWLGLLGTQGQSKEERKEARGAERDQKTVWHPKRGTICPGLCQIVVEFHHTS
jgi:hypothetical protein